MSGPLESSITLEEVFAVVSAKRVPLAPELAGYLVLEIAEGAGGGAGDVDPRQVYIGDEGTVALVRPQKRADANGDAEESIRGILQRLLDASGSQTPALDAAAKRSAGSGVASLSQELESALIPVNRAAARRALARLAREVKRVTLGVGRNASVPPGERLRGSNPSHPSFGRVSAEESRRKARPRDEVDSLLSAFEIEAPRPDSMVSRDLKEIAGLTPTPPPVTAMPASAREPSFPSVPISARDPTPVPVSVREVVYKSGGAASGAGGAASGVGGALSGAGGALSGAASAKQPTLRKLEAPPRPRGSNVWLVVVLILVLLAGGGILTWIVRSGFSRGPSPGAPGGGAKGTSPVAYASASASSAAGASGLVKGRPCKATVVVTDVPALAEVLVRAGNAPIDVARMPVGARLEFVLTADGHVPKRAVIPARAAWDADAGVGAAGASTPGGAAGALGGAAAAKPRYEMAVQLEKSRAKSGAVAPWPPGEPGSEVGGQGPPGTVHIGANPRGAEVWLLTGLGPEATIDQLSCDADVDLLVAGPSTFRKRLHIARAEFVEVASPGGEVARKARVSAK